MSKDKKALWLTDLRLHAEIKSNAALEGLKITAFVQKLLNLYLNEKEGK